jgi:signal transduction histidine kinase
MTVLPSIRKRLSRALVVISIVSALAVTAVVWVTVRAEADELLDDTLAASATVLAGLLANHAEALINARPSGGAAQSLAGDGEFAWQLVDRDHGVRLRSAHAPGEPFLDLPTLGFTDVDQWRVLGVAFGPGARVLYVAQTRAERRAVVAAIAGNCAAAALGVALLGLVWLRQQVRRELEPLAILSSAVTRFDPLQPASPLGPPQRTEFVPVHSAIEALGQRLAQRVDNERAVTAHAAHALRTPLAGIDAQLAVALRESPPELRPRLRQAREAAGRLQRVVTALITLFRSGGDLQRQAVDVAALLARLPIEGLEVKVQQPAVIEASPDLLAAALMNLLDNSLRHGAQRVDVSVSASHVRLHDNGPGVTPDRRRALQTAIDRQDDEGLLGLGLMLADRVARAHGGSLNLLTSEQGFAVELALAPTVADSPVSRIEP